MSKKRTPKETPACPRCDSADTLALTNRGKDIPGRFQCLGCKHWFWPENPPDAGGTGLPGPTPLAALLAQAHERIALVGECHEPWAAIAEAGRLVENARLSTGENARLYAFDAMVWLAIGILAFDSEDARAR